VNVEGFAAFPCTAVTPAQAFAFIETLPAQTFSYRLLTLFFGKDKLNGSGHVEKNGIATVATR
jgi:hypothetical protein